ncbi:MAG: hypothetical protein AAFN08_13555 [Cyanobacteria bacterium J06559_3]
MSHLIEPYGKCPLPGWGSCHPKCYGPEGYRRRDDPRELDDERREEDRELEDERRDDDRELEDRELEDERRDEDQELEDRELERPEDLVLLLVERLKPVLLLR